MNDAQIPADLATAFAAAPGATFEDRRGDAVALVPPDAYIAFMTAVRDAGYEMFVDLCGVDHLTRSPRFDVVVNVVSVTRNRRLRILVGIDGADPVCPTLTDVYPGANFYERETWDLLGIGFAGHPDLTRILLPDEWEGHPLRKDSPVGSIPVQFKEANKAT
jgi:NADH-quinone oxidoreductase subunit C